MRKLTPLLAALAGLTLAACQTVNPQYTSGQAYLDRYAAAPSGSPAASSIDEEIRRIAAVEPDFRLPAHFGLARLERGRISAIPTEELAAWSGLTDSLGEEWGEFVPISPLIAAMVAGPRDGYGLDVGATVRDIRRGAARQHVDYVLIYEVGVASETHRNALSITDWSVLGLFVMPSRDIEVAGMASALLLDVRNGYPYGATSVTVDRQALATAATGNDRRREASEIAHMEAVAQLTDQVRTVLTDTAAAALAAREAGPAGEAVSP
jgi:hypothetical protein